MQLNKMQLKNFLKKQLERVSIFNILISILLSLAITSYYQNYMKEQIAPKMEMKVIEYVGIKEGTWYREVCWKKGYHVYNFSISNVGKSAATEVRLIATIPGGIFAISVVTPYPGVVMCADPVATNYGIFDPVELGKWLGWQPLGREFDVVQGGPLLYVYFPYFAANSTFNFLVYFAENIVPGSTPLFNAKLLWIYEGESRPPIYLSNIIQKEVPLRKFTIWSNNPYKYPENKDTIIPYAHADMEPEKPGIQTTREVLVNQSFNINIVFDYRNTTHPYASMAISIFPEWYEHPIRLYKGTHDHNLFEWNVTIKAPSKPGIYFLRVIRSEYDYPEFYDCSDTGGAGFELTVYVAPA